jgi:hypothetical protein
MFISRRAPVGPRTSLIWLRFSGSIAGASSSGIPSANFSLRFSIEFVTQALSCGSDLLHGFM